MLTTTFAAQGKIDDSAHLRMTGDPVRYLNTSLGQSSRTVEKQAAKKLLEQDRHQE